MGSGWEGAASWFASFIIIITSEQEEESNLKLSLVGGRIPIAIPATPQAHATAPVSLKLPAVLGSPATARGRGKGTWLLDGERSEEAAHKGIEEMERGAWRWLAHCHRARPIQLFVVCLFCWFNFMHGHVQSTTRRWVTAMTAI